MSTPSKQHIELFSVVLLSVTTILTAWSAFESSKWGGAMSISFSEASSARIQAARLDGTANVRTSNHISLWTEWVAAEGAGDTRLATFVEQRFPEPLDHAHADWLAAGGFEADLATASSPFVMPSYVLDERVAAQEADARADERFSSALENNQRGDNYTLLTVLFASVLFFTALSGRLTAVRSQLTVLVMACVLFLAGAVLLVSFPKLI